MEKLYKKDGNKSFKAKPVCLKHFLVKYSREPNILDTVRFGKCPDCERKVVE